MKSWEEKTLNQISVNLDSKRIPITKNIRTNGNIPYYGASGIVDYVEDYLFNDDLLLVSEDGANLLARTNPIAFSISGKTWVNNHAHVLKFYNLITQKFVEIYLNSINLDGFVSGMAQPKLNQTMLNKIPIPLPPLNEQQRIVSILGEAFAAISKAKANAEQNLKNAKELFESYLGEVFEKEKKLEQLKPLVSYLELITYGFTNPMPTTDEGPYMITARNVKGGVVDYLTSRRTSQFAFDNLITDKCRPKIGDVLLTKDGTLGRLAVVEKTNLCINQSVALLRPKKELNPYYLKNLLSSQYFQKLMIEQAGGATIKHIYITRVDKMIIPVEINYVSHPIFI